MPRGSSRSKRPVNIEDLFGLHFVRAGSLSPDGRNYVFPVQIVREDRKGYQSNLYVVSTETGALRQFTYGDKSDGQPVYSPDGRWIAFVSKRGSFPGIHIMPADGGEARPLVERDGFFAELSFSPDSRKILCTFQSNDPVEGANEKAASNEPAGKSGAKKPADEPPAFRHIQRLFYRLDGRGYLPREEPQVWLYDIADGTGAKITDGKRGAVNPAFSPDGRQIAFVRNLRPDPDRDSELVDILVVSVNGGRPRRIPTPAGPSHHPSFSPDGRWIAYLGHDDLDGLWYENQRVWVVPSSGRGPARCLCPTFDQTAYDATIGDMGGGFFELRPHWSASGAHLYFVSSWHGSTRLYRVSRRGGRPAPVTPGRQHLADVSLSKDGRTAVGTLSRPTLPPEVHVFNTATGEGRRLTFLNRDWAEPLDIRKPKPLRIRSTEGTTVYGWLLTPPKFSPRRRYPAIVEVHGGPQTQYGHTFFHELQLLAARGYVVLYTNPRGSLGYGRAFAEAIRADWGNRDFADVMAATDLLAELPFVNPGRIGITGGSYGGYMTNWAIGHTRRYRAAVTQRSVVDLVPFFGSSDFGFAFHHTLGAYPWEDLENYRRVSPLTYARSIRTPLLILHSENDMRCNVEQAQNLFATLKVLRRTVELVLFPEESHGLSRGGRPDRRAARLQKIVEWFDRYL